MSIKNELDNLLLENNLAEKVYCTKEEEKLYSENIKNKQPLPSGVYKGAGKDIFLLDDCFYRVHRYKISEEDLKAYFALKQLAVLKTIKNCVLFFAILMIISIIITSALSCSM